MLALVPPQHVSYCDNSIPSYSSTRPLSRRPSSPNHASSAPSKLISSRTPSVNPTSSAHPASISTPSSSHSTPHRPLEHPSKSAPAVAPPHISTKSSPSATSSTTPMNPSKTGVDIHDVPAPQLLKLLASLLTQIAAANDSLTSPPLPTPRTSPTNESSRPPIWSSLTFASRQALATPASSLTFHARNVPQISLHAYLLRILKYCPASNDVFLALLVYFDRMNRLSEEATGRAFVIDSYNVHRLVIAGVTVASKFFSDVFYTNSRYAKVGGLPQAELNQLELQFLLLNDFRLVIHRDEMQYYAEQLLSFSQSHPPPNDDLCASPSPSHPQPPTPILQQHGYNTVSSFSSHGTSAVAGHRTPTLHYQQQQAVMGAIDAYGGRVPGEEALHSAPPPPSTAYASSSHVDTGMDTHHRSTPRRQTSSSSDGYETDSTMTETEGGETDDEPTIRPGRKMSVDSLATSEDDSEDHDQDMVMTRP